MTTRPEGFEILDKILLKHEKVINAPQGYHEIKVHHRKNSNLKCYVYITLYVDDLCIASESPSSIIDIFQD